MGLPTVINGSGAATLVGGTLMRPETVAAMAEASRAFVVLEDLNAKVGEKISEITGAEAGCVTAGSCAAMALAAAACIAGTDPKFIARLPDSTGMRNEIVIHRADRLGYDQMYRVGGAKMVEIGVPYATERWELERAITDRTAAVAYHDSRTPAPERSILRQWSKSRTPAAYLSSSIRHQRSLPSITFDAGSGGAPISSSTAAGRALGATGFGSACGTSRPDRGGTPKWISARCRRSRHEGQQRGDGRTLDRARSLP